MTSSPATSTYINWSLVLSLDSQLANPKATKGERKSQRGKTRRHFCLRRFASHISREIEVTSSPRLHVQYMKEKLVKMEDPVLTLRSGHQVRRLSASSVVDTNIEDCICLSEREEIICPWCRYQIIGRIRKKCQQHPNVIHLMDIICCPKCRGALK